VPIPNRLFVRLTVLAVEAPKVTQSSISERQRALYGDRATCYGIFFGSNYAFHLIAEGLAMCPFYVGFCTTYRFEVAVL